MPVNQRLIFQTTMVCFLTSWISAAPAILSFDQKAPSHARSSAGRALALPSSGQTPANVGRLKPGGGSPPSPPRGSAVPSQQDDVQREETVSFKEVNGETVRSVVGSYGYQSPEGLPISFKYMADENGNQASFSIGTAAAGGSGSKSRPSGSQKVGGGGGPGGAGQGGAGGSIKGGAGGPTKGGAGGSTKGGAGGDGDRKYLPPT